jgi:hypothetical protein
MTNWDFRSTTSALLFLLQRSSLKSERWWNHRKVCGHDSFQPPHYKIKALTQSWVINTKMQTELLCFDTWNYFLIECNGSGIGFKLLAHVTEVITFPLPRNQRKRRKRFWNSFAPCLKHAILKIGKISNMTSSSGKTTDRSQRGALYDPMLSSLLLIELEEVFHGLVVYNTYRQNQFYHWTHRKR